MEESIVRKKKKKTGTAKKVRTIIGRIFAVIGTTLGMMILCIYLIMVVCTHGPSKVARDLFVLSVRESSAGGFLANMVVSKSTIRKIEEGNKVADTTDTTDTSLIVFDNKNNQDDVTDDLDKSGHTPYLEKDGLLFYEVSGSTFAGTMVVVTDPSRVFVGTSGDYKGEAGINVPAICDNNNVFVIGQMTGQQAIDRGIRDAVSFGPFLILNGTPLEVSGMGGGLNPRTAIGQRADGAVLLLIIDGRQTHSLGASMNDLINVMLDFGAVNAANLDGGGSTVLYYDGEIKNKISSIYGARGVPTAIVVK